MKLRAWHEAEAERTLDRLVDGETRGLDGLALRIRRAAFDHASRRLTEFVDWLDARIELP